MLEAAEEIRENRLIFVNIAAAALPTLAVIAARMEECHMTSTAIRETPPGYDEIRIVQRPDGYYWQSKDGGREYGPFATLFAAVQDMQRNGESALEPGETLEEAESEIGIADWIDPDTGAPAEEDGTRTELH